ncbi:hypothetical protein BDW02DRAFT_569308 [Decorospora gaudefroyi]|uniref:Uncharacterized protein n=1 Tax=Decorospora gaudefroyi TaxID=184978 RepID=A0A6A5KF78_9PLEO|nr:hypothetical protein BDW02DRAFT_569308 [Decorospora gaudefroyi]
MSSYLHLTRTRTRDRTPDDDYYSRPLVRCNSNKRQRNITLSDDDDDGHDDYPYSSNHKPVRPSRALTVRDQPTQLERYNIWSDNRCTSLDEERHRSYETRRMHKHILDRHCPTDDEEAEFRLKINAALSRPRSSHHRHLSPTFRSKATWVDEDWVTRARSTSRERSRTRRDSFWGDVEEKEKESEEERWSRYRRVQTTKEAEWRPLSGWRRRRIIMED